MPTIKNARALVQAKSSITLPMRQLPMVQSPGHLITGGADALIHTVQQADSQWHQANTTDEYIDVHCWLFTPESFALILSDINRLGLLNLGIQAQFPTSGCEFYVSLESSERQKDEFVSDRVGVLNAIAKDGQFC